MKHRTPGQFINGLLKERGWSKRTLAIVLDVSEVVVGRIISDKRSIDPQMALILAEIFNCDAKQLLDIQMEYELGKARLHILPDEQRSLRAALYGDLPISDMIKRSWLNIKNIRDKQEVETALCDFFKVSDLKDIGLIPHAAKRTDVSAKATPVQAAWIQRVRSIAAEMLVSTYSPNKLSIALSRLKALLRSEVEMRHIPKILAEAGVRFLLVETLPRARIDGVCFWLDEVSPVVALTARYDRIDNFWFVLRHELEHVRRRHGLHEIVVDIDIMSEQNNVEVEEREANSAAAEFCVPPQLMEAFIRKKSPFFAERDICGFAKSIQVHPGLIAGQLQFRTSNYTRFRNHLVPVRSIVAPGAIVDGWGDVYPMEGGVA